MQIERELWLRVGNDDQHAYAEVFRVLYPRLYNYGDKLTMNLALVEDAIQDTLLSIWEKRKKLSSIEHPSTYFYTSFRYILLGKMTKETLP